MKVIKLFLTAMVILCCTATSFAIDLSQEADVRNYIEAISRKYDFDQAQLTNWFNQIDFVDIAVKKSQAAKAPTPFYIYRNKIITPARIKKGVVYWQKHRKALLKAQQRYGVPAAVILGILGIETTYGENIGHSSAFRGLATLAFKHPTRRPYFTDELTQFLLLSREHGWNPLVVPSSFDGGLGLPQFMPGSYRRYAVEADGSRGLPNLFSNNGDAIASIGNYLRAKGWQANQPVVMRARVLNNRYSQLENSNGKVNFTVADLRQQYGLTPVQAVSPQKKTGVLLLQNTLHKEYWLAFQNFSVIKTYNNSSNYAMTVYELGHAVLAAAAKNK